MGCLRLLAHDASLCRFEELENGLDLGTVGHLLANLVDDVEGARLSVEQQTVGVGNVLLYLGVEPALSIMVLLGPPYSRGFPPATTKGGMSCEKDVPACIMARRPTRVLAFWTAELEKMAPLWISQSPAILTP